MSDNIRRITLSYSLLFLSMFLPCQGFGQANNLEIQLVSRLANDDTTRAKKLLADSLQNKYFLLIVAENQEFDRVEIQVIDRARNPNRPLEIFLRKLPYLDIRETVSDHLELAFVLLKGSSKIEMKGTYRPMECPKSRFAYLILRKDRTLGLKYCLELPAPPDTVIKKVEVTHTIHETVCYRMPARRFLNYRVLSSGMVAGISSVWFLLERAEAQTKLDDYHRAVETAEVTRLRAEVEKSRTRRNIAGTLSAVAGTAFACFLAKDLFWPERKKALDCKERGAWDSNQKFHFGLQPSLNDNEVKITMSLNF